MKLLPSWPLEALALTIGIVTGAYVDHAVMQGRIDKTAAAHAEELRVRELQRAKDEVAARQEEQRLTQRAGQIEQEKTDAINRVRSDADSLIARLRNQTASKPANPSAVPKASTACETTFGGAISNGTGEDYVRLAERADKLRAGLSACYQAYDSVGH